MDESLGSFSSLYGCQDNLVVITVGWVEIWTLGDLNSSSPNKRELCYIKLQNSLLWLF